MFQFHLLAPFHHHLSSSLTRPFFSRTAANMTIRPLCPADGAPLHHKPKLSRCMLRLARSCGGYSNRCELSSLRDREPR
jgi:hypothetical protein